MMVSILFLLALMLSLWFGVKRGAPTSRTRERYGNPRLPNPRKPKSDKQQDDLLDDDM
jgi:hypothetical protein